jgi:hypothetical protein
MRKYFTLYINADKKKDVPKLLSIIRSNAAANNTGTTHTYNCCYKECPDKLVVILSGTYL